MSRASKREHVKVLLRDAVVALCNKGLSYRSEMTVEGLLGITLDKNEVVLVPIQEVIKGSSLSRQRSTVSTYLKPKSVMLTDGRRKHPRKPGRPRINPKKTPENETFSDWTPDGLVTPKRTQFCHDEPNKSSDSIPASEDCFDLDAVSETAKNTTIEHQPQGTIEYRPSETQLQTNIDHRSNLSVKPERCVENESKAGNQLIALPNPQVFGLEKAGLIEAVNQAVVEGHQRRIDRKRKRGEYNVYTDEMRAAIGKYASEHGITKAARKFTKEYGFPVSESTVRGLKVVYEAAADEARLSESNEDGTLEITVLPKAQRGRPHMMKEYDVDVMEYAHSMWRTGAKLTRQIVMDAARTIVLHKDRTRLKEFGGDIDISRKWAESFMKRARDSYESLQEGELLDINSIAHVIQNSSAKAEPLVELGNRSTSTILSLSTDTTTVTSLDRGMSQSAIDLMPAAIQSNTPSQAILNNNTSHNLTPSNVTVHVNLSALNESNQSSASPSQRLAAPPVNILNPHSKSQTSTALGTSHGLTTPTVVNINLLNDGNQTSTSRGITAPTAIYPSSTSTLVFPSSGGLPHLSASAGQSLVSNYLLQHGTPLPSHSQLIHPGLLVHPPTQHSSVYGNDPNLAGPPPPSAIQPPASNFPK